MIKKDRLFSVLLLINFLAAPGALLTNEQIHTPKKVEGLFQLHAAAGLEFPGFKTGDGIEMGWAASMTGSYFFSRKYGIGIHASGGVANFSNKVAEGEGKIERWTFYLEVGPTLKLGTPITKGLRPRLTAGCGLYDLDTKLIVNSNKVKQHLNMVAPGVFCGVGFDGDWDEGSTGYGFGIDISYRYLWKGDFSLPKGTDIRNLKFVRIALNIYASSASKSREL